MSTPAPASWASAYAFVHDSDLHDTVNADGITIRRPFTQAEYDQRLASVRAIMTDCGLDALVLTAPDSMYYLTSYQTPGNPFAALIVPLEQKPEKDLLLITRRLEASNVFFRSNVSYKAYNEGEAPEPLVAAHLHAIGLSGESTVKIGYEASSPRLTVRSQRLIESAYEKYAESAQWVDCSDLVLGLRSVKSEAEIACVRKAAEFVLEGYRAGIAALKPGVTETAIAGAFQRSMMQAGAEYAAYPAFVSSGRTGLLGHHAASRNTVQAGDVAFFEIGACYNRYHAARMHTVYVGSHPPAYYQAAEAMLKRAIAAGRSACVAGALAHDVDTAMRHEVGDLGHGLSYWMSHRSGYSIGTGLSTDWSERVLLIDPTSAATVLEGMTIHLIPWIQIDGIGAMGFSDTVYVGAVGTGPAVSLFSAEPPNYSPSPTTRFRNWFTSPSSIPTGSPNTSVEEIAESVAIDRATHIHQATSSAPISFVNLSVRAASSHVEVSLTPGCSSKANNRADKAKQAGTSRRQEPCPVCLDSIIKPVTLACSHILCAPCVAACSESGHQRCPVCRVPHLLDASRLTARSHVWRKDYAAWRQAGRRGAVGEIGSITHPGGELEMEGIASPCLVKSAGLLFLSEYLPPPPGTSLAATLKIRNEV